MCRSRAVYSERELAIGSKIQNDPGVLTSRTAEVGVDVRNGLARLKFEDDLPALCVDDLPDRAVARLVWAQEEHDAPVWQGRALLPILNSVSRAGHGSRRRNLTETPTQSQCNAHDEKCQNRKFPILGVGFL